MVLGSRVHLCYLWLQSDLACLVFCSRDAPDARVVDGAGVGSLAVAGGLALARLEEAVVLLSEHFLLEHFHSAADLRRVLLQLLSTRLVPQAARHSRGHLNRGVGLLLRGCQGQGALLSCVRALLGASLLLGLRLLARRQVEVVDDVRDVRHTRLWSGLLVHHGGGAPCWLGLNPRVDHR